MNFSHQNIKWIKHVTNKETGKAYLDIDTKRFILNYPVRFRNSILDVSVGDLIVIYQKVDFEPERYLTHIVRTIDNEVVDQPEKDDFRYGRVVESIAYTGLENRIPFDRSKLKDVDFRNRGWGNAVPLSKLPLLHDIEVYQKDIWKLFGPHMQLELDNNNSEFDIYLNDELDKDFESKEGKELYKLHRVRERDSTLTHQKKANAKTEGKLSCEVCEFSFQDKYNQVYIECHHKIPIHMGERVTKLEDLVLVCSNCHRMLHRRIDGRYLSIEELKALIVD